MTIVESSDPNRVRKAALRQLLIDRAVLTTAVVTELERATETFDPRPRSALVSLRNHIGDTSGGGFRLTDEWIRDHAVDDEFQALVTEIQLGGSVCDALAMLWTADSSVDVQQDTARIRLTFAEWRQAEAHGFTETVTTAKPAPTETGLDAEPTNTLYMVSHQELVLRKIGITVVDRVETWRRRGWCLVSTREFGDASSLRAAEHTVLNRLDQLGARSSGRMEALFTNLASDGRTEMYDPVRARHSLDALLSEPLGQSLQQIEPVPPAWISAPRKAAATKAMNHPDRDPSASAKRAWATRRSADAGGGAGSTNTTDIA